MGSILVLILVVIFNFHLSVPSFVFHETTHIMFTPVNTGVSNEYFGYSTLLSSDTLYVGAPKAANKLKEVTGIVFTCSLKNLDVKNVTCQPLPKRHSGNKLYLPYEPARDVWFGATMTFLAKDRLMVSAPRTKVQYDHKNLLMHGSSYFLTPRRCRVLDPLADGGRISHQAYVTDGVRKEYGADKTHIYYYAHGQVGFSMVVTKNNTIVLGAPGLLQWTGGIVSYSFNSSGPNTFMNLQPITNPYHTMDMEPDEYFGYSVDSGIFEKNGKVLYAAGAPRANLGSGKVLVFVPPIEELKPLDIRVKIVGPQMGSYFGASLCCTDINGDGLDDILVGAPTFVKNNGALPYDQGAVFVYMTKQVTSGFSLVESGHLLGSGADGARFGSTIADLGDVDGDGFRDVAVGAPWEDNGIGAVYIYMGYDKGLKNNNVQRIQPSGGRGFGMSIAKGVDVDQNNCNDLAIGAFNSATSYLYRCIPTMPISVSIRIPNAINLQHNETSFTAMFCVSSTPTKFLPDIKLRLIGKIQVDTEDHRAMIMEDSKYTIIAEPDNEICDQKTFYVNLTAELLKPILLTFEVETDELMKAESTSFNMNAARLSENSVLKSSSLVQLMRDCGDDLVCSPWLDMSLEPLDNPYVPGTNKTLGVRLTVQNIEEPAYGLVANLTFPMHPKRIPSECSLQDLIMTCDLPQPFLRNEVIVWDIELEYNLNVTKEVDLRVIAELSDTFFRNITYKSIEELVLNVKPEADFSISGKSMPNASMVILRDSLVTETDLLFSHYFEITNVGPSDWSSLIVIIRIPEKTNLSKPIENCKKVNSDYECSFSIPAKVSYPVSIQMIMKLKQEGEFLRQNVTYNATSSILISRNPASNYTSFEVTTTLILEPASIIWYIVIPCIFIGLLLLGIIVGILHKCGFFTRKNLEKLQREKDLLLQESDQSIDPDEDSDNQTLELLDDSN